MSNTNDAIKNTLERRFPDSHVEVEGVGASLTPFEVRLTDKNGKTFKVHTSLDLAGVVRAFEDAMFHEEAKAKPPTKPTSK